MAGTRQTWGPYGWKALHSVALLYPDNPTPSDKAALQSWVHAFGETIVCPFCKKHFGKMLDVFSKKTDIWASKNAFFHFTVKGHNTVSARLAKPQLRTYREAYDLYARNQMAPLREWYYMYIAHVHSIEASFDGVKAARYIGAMRALERGMFREWAAAIDWDRPNGITPFLDVDVSIPPDTTRRLQIAARTIPAPPAPPMRIAGSVIPAASIPLRLLSR